MKFVLGLGFACAIALGASGSAFAACDDPAAVAAARAAVEAQCPCDGFPNHGQYVKCARGVANDLAADDLLPRNCKGAVVSCAARSTCGKPGFVTCCRTDRRGNTKCSTKSDASKCTPPKDGSACVGLFASCCDACTDTGCAGGAPTPTPTPEPTPTPPGSAGLAFLDAGQSLLQ